MLINIKMNTHKLQSTLSYVVKQSVHFQNVFVFKH